jgi:arsenite methyltransferase
MTSSTTSAAPGFQFDDAVVQRLQAVYKTEDVVAQRRQVIAALDLRAGDKVIDIGTGPGYLAADMAKAVGSKGRVVAVDLNESMLQVARASCSEFAWIDLVNADAVRLPGGDGTFNAAVSTQVYEFVPDVQAALVDAWRVLRPGGRLVILDTDWDSLVWASSNDERMARLLKVWDGHLADPHLPRTLAGSLIDAGFEVDAVSAVPIVNTTYDQEVFSFYMSKQVAEFIAGRQGVTEGDVAGWLQDLEASHDARRYFFSLNRYLFVAHKGGTN